MIGKDGKVNLSAIEAQIDSTVPYYVFDLITEIKILRRRNDVEAVVGAALSDATLEAAWHAADEADDGNAATAMRAVLLAAVNAAWPPSTPSGSG